MTVNQATPHDEPTLVDAGAGVARGAAKAKAVPQPTVRWQRGRHVIAVVLIVLASLLSPLAIVSGWTQGPLKNSEAFAASLGGLARDPQVQGYITDEVVAAIDERVNIDGLVDDLVAGLSDVITRPASRTALNLLLRQTVVDRVNSAVRSTTASVVSSERFARAWEESLLVSHAHAVAILRGDPDVALTITDEGLGLRLGPIIELVKARLVEEGFGLASRIPDIDKTIVIVTSDKLPQAQTLYQTAVAGGFWLPLAVLGLLVVAVLVGVRRSRATLWASIGVALGALLVIVGLAVGKAVLLSSVAMPSAVGDLFYETLTGDLGDLAWATFLLAAVVGVAAWLAGSFASATTVRAGYAGVQGSVRASAESHGLTTGRVGEWLFSMRTLLRVVVGLLATGFLLLNRPLSVGLVGWTAGLALLALLVLSLSERPPAARAAD